MIVIKTLKEPVEKVEHMHKYLGNLSKEMKSVRKCQMEGGIKIQQQESGMALNDSSVDSKLKGWKNS